MSKSPTWRLINANGTPVVIGQSYLDHRGDPVTVTGLGQPPHKASSTGRVELDGRLYFPTVINAKWELS
jgi:hypothetical protein